MLNLIIEVTGMNNNKAAKNRWLPSEKKEMSSRIERVKQSFGTIKSDIQLTPEDLRRENIYTPRNSKL
jgi:hypothetical protein